MKDLPQATKRRNEREETRSHLQRLVCRFGLKLMPDYQLAESTVPKQPHTKTKEETDDDALGKLRSCAAFVLPVDLGLIMLIPKNSFKKKLLRVRSRSTGVTRFQCSSCWAARREASGPMSTSSVRSEFSLL